MCPPPGDLYYSEDLILNAILEVLCLRPLTILASYMVMDPLMVIVLLDLIRTLYGLRTISQDLIISRHHKVEDYNLRYIGRIKDTKQESY